MFLPRSLLPFPPFPIPSFLPHDFIPSCLSFFPTYRFLPSSFPSPVFCSTILTDSHCPSFPPYLFSSFLSTPSFLPSFLHHILLRPTKPHSLPRLIFPFYDFFPFFPPLFSLSFVSFSCPSCVPSWFLSFLPHSSIIYFFPLPSPFLLLPPSLYVSLLPVFLSSCLCILPLPLSFIYLHPLFLSSFCFCCPSLCPLSPPFNISYV